MGTRITDFAVNGGGKGLLMRAIPGLGKTHTSRIVLESLADKGTLRPVFAMPRHDLMVNLKDWKRIRPRQPRLHEQRSIPLPILQNRIEDAIEEAHVTGQVNYGTLPSLCHQWERANQLASRGWNVVSNLCMTDCSIGMGDCLYFNQFEQQGDWLQYMKHCSSHAFVTLYLVRKKKMLTVGKIQSHDYLP